MRSEETTVTKEEHGERTMKTSRSAVKYFFFRVDVCRRKYKEIEVIQEKQNYFGLLWVFFVLKL